MKRFLFAVALSLVASTTAGAQIDPVVSAEVSVLMRSTAPSRLAILASPTVSVLRERSQPVSSIITVLRESRSAVSAEVSVAVCPAPGPDDDCNGNGIDDSCELGAGDLDGDGILDECQEPPVEFVRADANRDGTIDLADALTIIDYLFVDLVVTCPSALDVDDNDAVSLGDALHVLCVLFTCPGVPAVPPPHPDCGPDPNPGSLDCEPEPGGCL